MKCAHPDCNKKLKLMKFTCKCQEHFCLKHMAPESHNCQFDYRIVENLEQKINETKCIAEKIKSI